MLRALPLLLLASCAVSSRWNVSHHNLGSQKSSYLVHQLENHYTGIQLEFLRIGEKVQAFLYVNSKGMNKEDSPSVSLMFSMEEKTWEGKAFVYEGGQKFKLDEESTQTLLEALLEKKSLTIQFDRYEETIDGSQFGEKYQKWIKDPIPWGSFLKKMF